MPSRANQHREVKGELVGSIEYEARSTTAALDVHASEEEGYRSLVIVRRRRDGREFSLRVPARHLPRFAELVAAAAKKLETPW